MKALSFILAIMAVMVAVVACGPKKEAQKVLVLRHQGSEGGIHERQQ